MQELILCKSVMLGGVGSFDGHLYELVEYSYILSSLYKVSMYITSDMESNIREIIEDRYTFNRKEKDALLNCIVIYDNSIINPDAIMVNVDGYLDLFIEHGVTIDVATVIAFRCFATTSDHISKFSSVHHVTLLVDTRIYHNTFDNVESVNYIKKLLFDKFRPVSECPPDNHFLYFNNECKQFSISNFISMRREYDNFYIVGPDDMSYVGELDGVTFDTLPAYGIFDNFTKYIYMGTTLDAIKEDCSCRLICECAFYDKDIIVDCSYELDIPTKVRLGDCDNVIQLSLTLDDELFSILEKYDININTNS